MVVKATFKAGAKLEDSRFAPYEGDIVFIIDDDILIHDDEIIEDFDVEYYKEIFEIVESVGG
jgi:hypothetical protein